jgi:LacI family transcriptional regulator
VLRHSGGCDEVEHALTPRLLAEGLPSGRGIPTAILAFDDDVAAVVLRAATRAGVAVPARLSVIGFTNILAPYTTPALCSHELYPFEAGITAARLLARLIRREVDEPQRIVFTPTFVCRESCGPAPSEG